MTRILPAALAALLTLLLSPTALAAKKIDTFRSSKDCGDKAVTWKIGYRFYWKDSEGRTLDRDTNLGKFFTNYALNEAKTFAQRVPEHSDCGVQVVLDVWDMEDAAWQAHDGSTFKGQDGRLVLLGAPDAEDFRAQNDYDVAFYRVPRSGREAYSGRTQGLDVEMPMQTNVAYGPQVGLLFHEWLHTAEFFLTGKIAQGFPNGGVHGACNYRQYFPQCGYVDEQYFAAMMKGQVPEAGGRFSGIKVDEWKKFGRPRAPGASASPSQGETMEPPFEPAFEPRLSLEQDGRTLIGNATASGPLLVTLHDPDTGEVLRSREVEGSFELALEGGEYIACLYFAGDALFSSAQRCERVVVARPLDRFLDVDKGRFGRATLTARGPALGRRALLRWTFVKCKLDRSSDISCAERVVMRSRRLKRSQELRAPKSRKGEQGVALDVLVGEFAAGGKLYETTPGGVGTYWIK